MVSYHILIMMAYIRAWTLLLVGIGIAELCLFLCLLSMSLHSQSSFGSSNAFRRSGGFTSVSCLLLHELHGESSIEKR